jgi:hypothetical protein
VINPKEKEIVAYHEAGHALGRGVARARDHGDLRNPVRADLLVDAAGRLLAVLALSHRRNVEEERLAGRLERRKLLAASPPSGTRSSSRPRTGTS